MLKWGQLGMFIMLIVSGICLQQNLGMVAFVFLCVHIFIYQITQGSVCWLYVPEVTVDKASSVCMVAQFATMLGLSMTFEYQLASPMGVHGTFWQFGILSLLGFFFMVFFVRESSGLTDAQKKRLYSPKEIEQEGITSKPAPKEILEVEMAPEADQVAAL